MEPVVRARLNPMGEGLQVMVYVPDQPHLFARLAADHDGIAGLPFTFHHVRLRTVRCQDHAAE